MGFCEGMEMDQEKETREWYRRKIIEMVGRINNKDMLKMIYNFVCSFEREERAGE